MQAQQALDIEARSKLDQPVWSHLNAFTYLTFTGLGKLSLTFSACPDHRLEPAETNRPSQFAYIDAENLFHIVEARRAEKGPFREIASGKLERGAPLTITFCDAGSPIFRVTWKDWEAQASRQLSPTAGWGVPENSIEFFSDRPGSMQLYISLAATSVGRGFDTVGHAAGIYTNRMSIETVEAAAGR